MGPGLVLNRPRYLQLYLDAIVVDPTSVFLELVMKLWDTREGLLTKEFLPEMSKDVVGNSIDAPIVVNSLSGLRFQLGG